MTEEISPSNGATTSPISGSIPTPSPSTPEANVSSGISSLGITFPFNGANSILAAGSIFFSSSVFFVFSFSSTSSFHVNQVSVKEIPKETIKMMAYCMV